MNMKPGILALWNNCAEEGRIEYERWYMKEHLPERINVPGFRFGRRYTRLEGDREFFTFYETDSEDVLWSPAYMRRLSNPTEWTQNVMNYFRDTIRTVCCRETSVGYATGGHVTTFRFSGTRVLGASDIQNISRIILNTISKQDGFCRSQLWASTAKQTPSDTAETKIRGADEMLSWAVIIESTNEGMARSIANDLGFGQRLRNVDRLSKYDVGVYCLTCIMTR